MKNNLFTKTLQRGQTQELKLLIRTFENNKFICKQEELMKRIIEWAPERNLQEFRNILTGLGITGSLKMFQEKVSSKMVSFTIERLNGKKAEIILEVSEPWNKIAVEENELTKEYFVRKTANEKQYELLMFREDFMTETGKRVIISYPVKNTEKWDYFEAAFYIRDFKLSVIFSNVEYKPLNACIKLFFSNIDKKSIDKEKIKLSTIYKSFNDYFEAESEKNKKCIIRITQSNFPEIKEAKFEKNRVTEYMESCGKEEIRVNEEGSWKWVKDQSRIEVTAFKGKFSYSVKNYDSCEVKISSGILTIESLVADIKNKRIQLQEELSEK